MKDSLLKDVKNYIARNAGDEIADPVAEKLAEEKLHNILSCAETPEDVSAKNEIEAFAAESSINKSKLLTFCSEFPSEVTDEPQVFTQDQSIDIATKTETDIPQNEKTELHAFLGEDSLMKLYLFVKMHETDKSFGRTVYDILDKHGMTTSDVYKNAQLRRQNFSRATDFRSKGVTRQLVWQIIIGLHCNIQEADEVLFSAGFIRTNSRLDLIMEYFIRRENYDVLAINDVLNEFGLKPFSCYKPVKDSDNQ